jgi:DMSO/TMAO reductase YedYZ molybdopterin-dependent catalytic subunit
MDPASGIRLLKLQPHEMTDAVTATDDMFVIAHLGVPRIDPAAWSLTIDGLIRSTRTLRLDDLRALPKIEVEAVHNCCGSPFEPTVPTRRIANVRWGGVDLATLLAGLGVDPLARHLWSYGLDGGDFFGKQCDWYLKSLPLARLEAGGVLIAYEVNGEPLPAEHGFPARLVVPGYYGTNSVKWLWRMQLAEERAEGLFASELYNDDATADEVTAGLPPRRPVWAVAPDSVIVTPAPDSVLAAGKPTEIAGWAWSHRGIASVLVSADEGESFARAALEERRGWAWQRFTLPWTPAEPGEAVLRACAVEAGGASQPFDGARNAMHRVRVVVE